MRHQNKHSQWDPFPAQWIWVLILVSELVLFLVLQLAFGAWAYFLLGPVIVYNLGIYFFPYLLFFLKPPQAVQNRLAQTWKKDLQSHFPGAIKIHFFLRQDDSSPLFVLSHGSTVWVLASEDFLSRFSDLETALIQSQIYQLWKKGHLAHATTWTALQKTLPLWLVRNPRGKELMFYVDEDTLASPAEWCRLCLKVFHWMSHRTDASSPALSPSVFFPTLTSYSEKSYSSLYQFLQMELIESLKEGDPTHEPTKSGSFVFNPDPFHRLDGSNGPGIGPSPADRQN